MPGSFGLGCFEPNCKTVTVVNSKFSMKTISFLFSIFAIKSEYKL